ncbi:hypothetical protein [Arthrobacter alpinus]|nr:hypothetical protein [Arthrobacter alpinus]
METKRMRPTACSNVELAGTANRQSIKELKRNKEYWGGEIAAHSWSSATHTVAFTAVTPELLDTELRLMKEWLIDNGFQGRDLVAHPLGKFNGAVMNIASKQYKFARTVNIRQQETQPPGNPFTCRAQSSTNTVTLAQITAQVDAAYANGTRLNLPYHDIVPTPGTAGHASEL